MKKNSIPTFLKSLERRLDKDNITMAQRSSILYEQYAAHPHQSFNESEPISPLRASIDPRFSSLLTRAAVNRERLSQQKVSPNDWTHLPSTATVNYNAWSPETSTTKLEISKPNS